MLLKSRPRSLTTGGEFDYRYANREFVPFAGKLPLVEPHEYQSLTQRVAKGGYGLFDVRDPDQRFFGRTLQEIMNRVYVGEFVIAKWEEYKYSKGGELRLFVFCAWYEQFDIPKAAVREYLEQGSVNGRQHGEAGGGEEAGPAGRDSAGQGVDQAVGSGQPRPRGRRRRHLANAPAQQRAAGVRPAGPPRAANLHLPESQS